MDKDIIAAQEKTRNTFFETQAEKIKYLQEFKENIIISLNKEDVESGFIYPEIIEAMHEPDAVLLKMRRDIPLKCLKPYIEVAEKIGLRYTLIDNVNIVGEIGMVVVSKDAMDNKKIDLKIDNLGKKFKEKGLDEDYPKYIGQKICSKHYKMVEQKYPLYRGSFTEFSFWDKLFGHVCPLCEKKGEKEKK